MNVGRRALRNDSIKPVLMQTALEAAARRGYQALRVSDITDPAEVTRQAFYAHFRDKRHCLCEALDPHLAAIERLAASADADGHRRGPLTVAGQGSSRLDDGLPSEWTSDIVMTIDELLIEHFGSAEGTKGRLMESLAAELEEAEGLPGIRIGSIVKRARVPQGDFYRHFSGKRGCFAALYKERLESLVQGVRLEAIELASARRPGRDEILLALGSELESDPGRARLLTVSEGELPDPGDQHLVGARRGDLGQAISRLLLGAGSEPSPLLTGALVEVIRSAVLSESLDGLTPQLLQTAALIDPKGRSASTSLAA